MKPHTLAVEPWMTHERLDDQVMMINLETGAYFALEKVAADCWTAAVAGWSIDEIVAEVPRRYQVDPTAARRDVFAFITSLVEEGLLRWTDGPASSDSVLSPAGSRQPYVAPLLEKHDDLEELLLLDPIHDVSPEGWPTVG